MPKGRNKPPRPTDGDNNGYTVGYRKPPLHSRYRPGQTGYPSGRRKGVRNLKTDVRRTLATPVKVKEGGRVRKKSTQESALMVLRDKALSGDSRALARLIELAGQYNNDVVENETTELPADDQAILAAYVAEVTGGKNGTADVNAPDQGSTEDNLKALK